MRFRLWFGWVAAFGLGLGLAPVCPGQTNSPVPPAEKAPAPSTAPAAKPQDRLNRLEDELRRALHSFSPRDAVDSTPGVPLYTRPIPVLPRGQLNQADHSKDWMFIDPKDPAASVAEQWLNKDKPDDSDRYNIFAPKAEKQKSDLERFYDQLNQQRNSLNPDDPTRFKPDTLFSLPGKQQDQQNQAQDQNADDKLPSQLRGPTKKLKSLLSSSPLENAPDPWSPSTLSDWFGSSTPASGSTLSPDQVKAHQAYMDEYRKIFDAPATLPTTPTPITAVNPANPALSTLPDYGGLNSLKAPNNPGLAGTLHAPSALDNQNATVLNRWNPLYTPPQPEQSKPMPLFSAPFEVPRRRF